MDHLLQIEQSEMQNVKIFSFFAINFFNLRFLLSEEKSQVLIKIKLSQVGDAILILCTIQ